MAGVATQLGLDGLDSELLREAAARWPGWVGADRRLRPVTALAGLRPWLRAVDADQADGLLQGLARLGSPSGGDEVPAAGALAWALLPGACLVARRLQSLSPRIDELVAAQLWIEVRTFPWWRLTRVAANILANMRAAVMRDCGVHGQVERADRTWGHTRAVDPTSPSWAALTDPPVEAPAEEELAELLDWACRARVISEHDRALLVSLVATAGRSSMALPARRGRSGLMTTEVSTAVAEAFGLSPVTVRRRARSSMATLSRACIEAEWTAA